MKTATRRVISQQAWFLVLVIAGSGVLCVTALLFARSDALAASDDLSHAVNSIATEQANRSVGLVAYRLGHIAAEFSGRKPPVDAAAAALLASERMALPHCQGLALLDAAGRVRHSDFEGGGPGNLATIDQAGIRAVVTRMATIPPRELVFDVVTEGGQTAIYAGLAHRASGAAAASITVARLDPAYFNGLWSGLNLGADGVIALVRSDGLLIAALPASQTGARQIGAAMRTLTAGGVAIGMARMTRREPLPGYPGLQLATSRSVYALLAPWRHFALLVAALWLVGSLGVAALFMRLRLTLNREVEAALSLRRVDQKFAAAFRASPDGISLSTMEGGQFIEVSDSIVRWSGYTREQLLGPVVRAGSMWADEADRVRFIETIKRDGRVLRQEARFRVRSGLERIVQVSGELIVGDGGALIMAVVRDITAQKEQEQLVWRQANVDSLTGLPNRHLFLTQLQQLLDRPADAAHPFALLLIDLDQFREVNDTLGHEAGDQLLVAVAGRLQATLIPTATLARLGGDEFSISLDGADDPVALAAFLERVVASLACPFEIGANTVFVSASVGVARFPEGGSSAEDLLRHADQAMYAAKQAGRNRYCHYAPAMQDDASARAALTTDLRAALAGGQFSLAYQPIVAMADGSIAKAEALLRWEHPVRGNVSPALFIPVAEQSGLIIEIGDWVFHQAAAVLAQLRREIDPAFEISINVSPVQFKNDRGLPARWLAHLAQLGVDPAGMTIEITEGLLLDVSDDVRTSLAILGGAGMQTALDDFGTGYSSLAYLKKFDIDFLKIDRAFVNHIETDPEDRALCEAIVAMAHTLGLRVTVEGVETAEQYALMRQMACDYAQGYFLSRAVPVASLMLLCAGSRSGR